MFCRLNTFGAKVKVGTDINGLDIEHAVHEYHDTLQNIYLGDFMESEEFAKFCQRSGKTGISFSKFVEGALQCPCIQAPKMRVCVDELKLDLVNLFLL